MPLVVDLQDSFCWRCARATTAQAGGEGGTEGMDAFCWLSCTAMPAALALVEKGTTTMTQTAGGLTLQQSGWQSPVLQGSGMRLGSPWGSPASRGAGATLQLLVKPFVLAAATHHASGVGQEKSLLLDLCPVALPVQIVNGQEKLPPSVLCPVALPCADCQRTCRSPKP